MTAITIASEGIPLAYAPATAARLIGISRAGMYKLLHDGALPAVKVAGRIFVRRDDLQAFLDNAQPLVSTATAK